MSNRTPITFRVRNRTKAGPSGGKTLSGDVPVFSFDEFRKTPNADEFVKKCYFAAARAIIRDIDEGKNGTQLSDLQSMESIVVRSLKFTKEDIREWVQSRDWTRVKDNKDIAALAKKMEEHLPELAMRINIFDPETSKTIADKVVAAVCDQEDRVAEFLFTTLTTDRNDSRYEALGF